MDELGAHESRLYSDWAPLYDKTFAKFFYSRERTVIRDLNLPANAEILEVGVGTGTSLPAYPHNCHITGIDQAPLMLARAREKIEQKQLAPPRSQGDGRSEPHLLGQRLRLRGGIPTWCRWCRTPSGW